MKKALLALHVAIFLAGFTGILGRLITLNEGLLVWWRLLITSGTLAIFFLWRGGLQKASFSLHLRIFVKYANVSVALLCFSAIGFFSAFFEPLILRKKIDRVEVWYGALAIIGIWLIFHFDDQYKTGILLGIISSLFAGLFPVLNKKLIEHIGPQSLTFYELTGGLVVLTLGMPFYIRSFPEDHILPTAGDFFWLLVLSWFCTVLAFNLSLQALKKISPFTVNLSYNLEPVYGIILAFIVYNENKYLSSGFYYGLTLILMTVVLQTRRLYYSSR